MLRLPALVDEGERIAKESLEAGREVVVKADSVVEGLCWSAEAPERSLVRGEDDHRD